MERLFPLLGILCSTPVAIHHSNSQEPAEYVHKRRRSAQYYRMLRSKLTSKRAQALIPPIYVKFAPELWLSIFANLPLLSKLAISDTCSTWRALIASSPNLWSSFTLTSPPPTTDVRSHAACARAVSQYIRNHFPERLFNDFDSPLPVCDRTGQQLSPKLLRILSCTMATQLSISFFMPYISSSWGSYSSMAWPCIMDLLKLLSPASDVSESTSITSRVRDLVVIVDQPGQLHSLMATHLNQVRTFTLVSLLDVAAERGAFWKYTSKHDLPPLLDLAEYISSRSTRLQELRFANTLLQLRRLPDPPLVSLRMLNFEPCRPAELITALLGSPNLRELIISVGTLSNWHMEEKPSDAQIVLARNVAARLDVLEVRGVNDGTPPLITGILDHQHPRDVIISYRPLVPYEIHELEKESGWSDLRNIDFSIFEAVTSPTHLSITVDLSKRLTFALKNAGGASREVSLPRNALSQVHRIEAVSAARLPDDTSWQTLQSLHLNHAFLSDISFPDPTFPLPANYIRPPVLVSLRSLTLDFDTCADFANARSEMVTFSALIPRSARVTAVLLPPRNWMSREERERNTWERDECCNGIMRCFGTKTTFVGWYS